MGRVAAQTPAEVARLWVEKSCEEQGVPVKVGDSTALASVVVQLAAGRPTQGPGRRNR